MPQPDSLYYHVIAEDGGPIYVETNLDNFVVEPFNAVSAFLFLFIVGYWFRKIDGRYQKHTFLTLSVPVLLVGGIGGTLYHAFRVSEVFLVMDWLPIFLLTMAATAYYLFRVMGQWRYVFLSMSVILLLEIINFRVFEAQGIYSAHTATNVSYAIVGIFTVSAVFLLLSRTRFRHFRSIVYALTAFALALFFRIADPWALLPVGTHFLWHTFGALSCHFIFQYTYKLNEYPPVGRWVSTRTQEAPDAENRPGSAAGRKTDSETPSGYRGTQQ